MEPKQKTGIDVVEGNKIKTPKERDDFDLLELVCELLFRSMSYGHKETHARYFEAREELESRLRGYTAAKEDKGCVHPYENVIQCGTKIHCCKCGTDLK